MPGPGFYGNFKSWLQSETVPPLPNWRILFCFWFSMLTYLVGTGADLIPNEVHVSRNWIVSSWRLIFVVQVNGLVCILFEHNCLISTAHWERIEGVGWRHYDDAYQSIVAMRLCNGKWVARLVILCVWNELNHSSYCLLNGIALKAAVWFALRVCWGTWNWSWCASFQSLGVARENTSLPTLKMIIIKDRINDSITMIKIIKPDHKSGYFPNRLQWRKNSINQISSLLNSSNL